MDFEFCALLACSIFGWTVAEVFDLTFPQFSSVVASLSRLQAWRARGEVFLGITGAFGDEKARNALFDEAGTLYKEIGAEDYAKVDADALRKAEERMRQILQERTKDGGG